MFSSNSVTVRSYFITSLFCPPLGVWLNVSKWSLPLLEKPLAIPTYNKAYSCKYGTHDNKNFGLIKFIVNSKFTLYCNLQYLYNVKSEDCSSQTLFASILAIHGGVKYVKYDSGNRK